ncbi:MAG: hypothetical protein ACRDP4_15555 [Nocardioidaceae bacterium]
MTADPNPRDLCSSQFSDLDLPTEWHTASNPDDATICGHWTADTGADLTLFATEQQGADDMIAADAVTLLTGGGFEPTQPMIAGHRLSGRITADSSAGPCQLDVAAVEGSEGSQRLVLQRPVRAD